MNNLTVVMYHYVRDFKTSKYKGLKGLQVELFEKQIVFLKENYNIIGIKEVYDYILHQKSLPIKAVLLTFDDGYIDHYQFVFPLLKKYGLTGAFFVPVMTAQRKKVLDVNIIHHVLGEVEDSQMLIKRVLSLVETNRKKFNLERDQYYLEKYCQPNRFDSAETMFVKRMLQVALPYELRREICLELLQEFLKISEQELAHDLYMGMNEIIEMSAAGMFFGGHGYKHKWLNSLSSEEITDEIDHTLAFLKEIGMDTEKWSICYPYGGFNDDVLKIIKDKKCLIGFTTEMRMSNLKTDNPLLIPRFDTNDIKFEG